ncbi:MAG: ribosome recycling factor [Phycisphaerae bacterium]|nr:ribosome recycling factor [Phycisphaerae bacterium]
MPTDDILLEAEEHMESAVEYFRNELRGIRTGRASSGLVEHVKVDYYGSPTDLRKLASIATPEANLIVIKPFDPSSISEIDKALQTSDLGITPQSDGKVIRLTIPPLSGERRDQLVNQVKKMAEQSRVAVRNARRDANKQADKEKKAGDMPEDDAKRCKDEVQKLTDQYEQAVDELLDAKVKDIHEL